MTVVGRLLSVNVGLPRDISWRGKIVHTAIWKEPVQGRRSARRLNLDGDGQGDLAGHGGEHRAVMVYQSGSYRYWERYFGRAFPSHGQFGENLTVEGLPDDAVCIGDRYQIGSTLFEVTQPRVTCYRVGIRVDEPMMASLLVAHRRPGFYMRVLREGDVGAGDEIVKLSTGLEQMTVAEIDALLYLPGHSREQLQRALKLSALPAGWQASFQALLEQERTGNAGNGNSGLAGTLAGAPAWPGFRAMRISAVSQESKAVFSLLLIAGDGGALHAAEPGQFIVLRVLAEADSSPMLRSYSLSGAPGSGHYRISVKEEIRGRVSGFLKRNMRVGDVLEIAAPRGSFVLGAGDNPVVFLSAGVGVTPVLAMLHALAERQSTRPIWWLFGARDGEDHPFAVEVDALLGMLPRAKRYVKYSRPGPRDEAGKDFDAAGRLGVCDVARLQIPGDADFYICGPPLFMKALRAGLRDMGFPASQMHSEIFGSLPPSTPGIKNGVSPIPHQPPPVDDAGPQVMFVRSGLAVPWSSRYGSLLELAEACDVPTKWSCRAGVCHACETGLVAGQVRYETNPIEPAAEGHVLLCCCQPDGEIALDL